MKAPRSLCYVAHVRTLPCIICGKPAESHHLQAVGMGRDRKRDLVCHYTVIPLCRDHHIEVETKGTARFTEKYNINLWREGLMTLALFLWSSQ